MAQQALPVYVRGSAHLVQCSEPEPQYCNLRKERRGSGSLGDAGGMGFLPGIKTHQMWRRYHLTAQSEE